MPLNPVSCKVLLEAAQEVRVHGGDQGEEATQDQELRHMRYDSRSGTHIMYREYRDMGARHRAIFRLVPS